MDNKVFEELGKDFQEADFNQGELLTSSIFARLDKVFERQGWGISYSDLDECYGCTVTIAGVGKTGIGDSIPKALIDAVSLWGMKITMPEKKATPTAPPVPEAPKPETQIKDTPAPAAAPKVASVWTESRKKSMREIKTKLKILDNEQFGVHINVWSNGKIDTLSALTEENVDKFIEYMYTKYIRPIKKSGFEGAPAASGSQASVKEDEAPY